MGKTDTVRKAKGMAAVLLVLIVLPASHARGGETGRSVFSSRTGTARGKSLLLSLRIAEVKGNEAVLIYVRSLLRQEKRNPLMRRNRSGHAASLFPFTILESRNPYRRENPG